MKYFVAHLLSGEAQRYHERLTRELSHRFDIVPLHERVPPHLTIKIPFEANTEQIEELERVLRSFARTHEARELTLKGFGHFGFRTVYLDVASGDPSVQIARECLKTLRDHVPWLSHGPLEGNKLHASVARFLTRKQFARIWRMLKIAHPHFTTLFDNIAILKKKGPCGLYTRTLRCPKHLFTRRICRFHRHQRVELDNTVAV